MIRLALIAAAACLPSAALAANDDAENTKDMRCLIVAAEMAESKDKETETAGLIASQYYLGRIDGRSPNANLEKLLVDAAMSLNEDEKPQLMMSCAQKIEDRGKAMEAVGTKLEAEAGE